MLDNDSSPGPSDVVKAFDKAKAVQEKLADAFKKSALPVEAVSVVFAVGHDLPGVAIHLSREPTREELPQLPTSRDGVYVQYYTRKDGKTVKLDHGA